ncbi:MAG: AraC family transcriptional regulator [Bacteroidales bacterium]|nr:AraC family transcriptional regulator [Bacteroidales bacterium]
MNDAIHLKYLAVSPEDLRWGIAVNSVGFQEVGPGEPYPPSEHPSRYLFSTERGRTLAEYQLLYITRGHGRFRSTHVPDGTLIRPGYLFLLFPGEWHTYRPEPSTGWKEFWIGFNGAMVEEWVKSGFFSREKPVLHVGLHSDIVNLYNDAIHTAAFQQSGFQQCLGGIVAHLMGLARLYQRQETFSEVRDKINQAKIIIGEQYRTIRPEEVASQLYMGYSNFRRIFKEYTGFAPAQYIQEVRLNRIKELLTNTTLPIKEIADECGLENYDYFFTLFRRLTGMTPSDYRNNTQGK